MMPWPNRLDAAQALAEKIMTTLKPGDGWVIGLNSGGMLVAHQIAKQLNLLQDIILTRALVTADKKTILGVIAPNNVRIIDRQQVDLLKIPPQDLDRLTGQAAVDIQRRLQRYRGDRPMPALKGKPVILVADALIDELTPWAAVRAIKRLEPASLTLASPLADALVLAAVKDEVDDTICLQIVDESLEMGQVYPQSPTVSDQDVMDCLAK